MKRLLSSRPIPQSPVPFSPLPKRYNGDQQHFRGFLVQCCFLFQAQPDTYSRDQGKVSLIICYLMGEALNWASPLMEHNSLILKEWEVFLQEYGTTFDDFHWARMAETELRNLCQVRVLLPPMHPFSTFTQQRPNRMRWPSITSSGRVCGKQ